METQYSISEWAEETFGCLGSNAKCAARANEEMAELLTKLTIHDFNQGAASEIADVVITLYRLASRLGVSLTAEVERKMAINRQRTWERDGLGGGHHVKTSQR